MVGTELIMHANHVDTGKQNAAVNDLSVGTARTLRLSVTMRMVRETG